MELRYTAATDYLRFCGQYWWSPSSRQWARQRNFLDLQLADAKDEIARTKQALMDTGISEMPSPPAASRWKRRSAAGRWTPTLRICPPRRIGRS